MCGVRKLDDENGNTDLEEILVYNGGNISHLKYDRIIKLKETKRMRFVVYYSTFR